MECKTCKDCLFTNLESGECMVNFPADWGYSNKLCEEFIDRNKVIITKFPDGISKLWDIKKGKEYTKEGE